MKERPILFTGAMVRAVLAGTKRQTRRICKPAATLSAVVAVQDPDEQPFGQRPAYLTPGWFGDEDGESQFFSPYGAPGDRLWVRETHAPQPDCLISWSKWMAGAGGEKPIIHYAADASDRAWVEKWRPSIHMPRWASRITLEVTGVRVERLQDISTNDAEAEGVARTGPGITYPFRDYLALAEPMRRFYPRAQDSYRSLWESINGPGSWAVNPWVWVIDFKRIAP